MHRPPARAVPVSRRGRGLVALSTASVYPESTASCFELAARLGYDGVEVMVGTDPLSQDVAALRQLRDYHGLPVVAVHAPCLLLTQRVWGSDPRAKLARTVQAARDLGAGVVVVHPPFRWQRDYAQAFGDLVAAASAGSGVAVAVENMYPWRAAGRDVVGYLPHWDPRGQGYPNVTLDLSHAAAAGTDGLQLARDLLGRIRHLHLTDGSGANRDEHLVPGRGRQPGAQVLGLLAEHGYDGAVVVEINTRRAESRSEREADLAESLAFARRHFARAARFAVAADGTIERLCHRRSPGS